MYAGNDFRWHQVTKTRTKSSNSETLPLFMCAFSCEKGPETITDLVADDFFKLYGKTADFFKYGQPLIQAHNIAKAGGRVLGYRVCATDSKLANIIISATVTTEAVNKKDADGNQIYLNSDGDETTEVTTTPATFNAAKIKYVAQTVTNATNYAAVMEQAAKLASDTVYPLLVVTDNGRGVSIKNARIAPDYSTSKSLSFCMYKLFDLENGSEVESTRFSINPDAQYAMNGNSKSMNLIESSTLQFKTGMITEGIKAFAKKVSDITGYSIEELFKLDLMFGCTLRGVALDNILVDATGVNLQHVYGIGLQSGDNGNFGAAPFPGEKSTPEWEAVAASYFAGDITDEVFDYDLHKIDFLCDANYPTKVKNKIVELAKWRKDFEYFRDLGTDIWSYDDVYSKVSNEDWLKSAFVMDYLSTYEIIDNYSKKQVRVTMTHGLSALLVGHYGRNIAAPIAGSFNGFVITEAVEGTLNFAPRKTPRVDQKELLDDMRVNFANYIANTSQLIVQSTYTSQDKWGPLSYGSNVIVTQMLVKAIRAYVPGIRFQLMESGDFTKYQQLIKDNAMAPFAKFFKQVDLVYTEDPEMSANKIFDASIECYYYDFAQSEIFDVFAIEGSPDDDSSSYTTNTSDVI